MKQVEATILGQSYILGCPEGGEAALLEAVAAVDREMSAIRDGGKVKARERIAVLAVKARERIAVLAALNLAFALAERPHAPSARDGDDESDAADNAQGDGASASGVDLAALIRRVDMALGADGQLI